MNQNLNSPRKFMLLLTHYQTCTIRDYCKKFQSPAVGGGIQSGGVCIGLSLSSFGKVKFCSDDRLI